MKNTVIKPEISMKQINDVLEEHYAITIEEDFAIYEWLKDHSNRKNLFEKINEGIPLIETTFELNRKLVDAGYSDDDVWCQHHDFVLKQLEIILNQLDYTTPIYA